MTPSRLVYVVDYARTMIGKFNGALSTTRPDDLAATVLAALSGRHPDAVNGVDDIYFGNYFGSANGAGEENRNVARKDDRPFQHHDKTLYSTSIGWRMVNPAMPAEHTIPKGDAAWQNGRLARETVPGPDDLRRDESIRPDGDLATLGRLRPAFRPAPDGTVTAGNSSPLSDGAAAVLLASEPAVREYGLTPVARITASGGTALACLKEWQTVPPDRVNPNGGAIAIGHPLGCTGARLVGTLAMELRARGVGVGVATACTGVGQGLAVVLAA